MPARPFHIVDVFAERKYAGNQLAVITDATGMDTAEMQAIARETNFSETTFLTATTEIDGAWRVRIFTPGEEVPFAGHPTLGTAWIIRNRLLDGSAERIELDLKVGRIPVTFDTSEPGDDVLWMRQRPPEFLDEESAETLAAVLRLEVGDIDERFPIQTVSTGLPFWIVPVKSLAAVARARIDARRYEELIRDRTGKAVFFFAPGSTEAGNHVHARMFADHFGVPEDPATGSANGCLAGWLVQHRFFGDDSIDLRVEQGYEMGRPSLLRLKAARHAGEIDIRVGGRVVPTARGELL